MKKIVPQYCRVVFNRRTDTKGCYYSLMVEGFRATGKVSPGQFVHLKPGPGLDPYFRRAFSIAGWDRERGRLEIIYKIVGRGTALMAELTRGDRVDLIGPLGNSFSRPGKKTITVLVAGGVGLPPLLFMAQTLVDTGFPRDKIYFFYGGRTRHDLVRLSDLRRLGLKLITSTDDGSYGFSGFITDALASRLPDFDRQKTFIIGCGPEPMLAALQNLALEQGLVGELSLEAPMPCGVGVCLGCVKPRREEPRRYVRVCHDGPVFRIGEVSL